MDKILALYTVIGISPVIMAGVSNSIEFFRSYTTYQKLKKQFPDDYKKKINSHYEKMQEESEQMFSPKEIMNLKGADVAKYVVLR